MTLTQIEYVLAVDRFRHFGQAADFCHVAQPTLSLQLQKLEDDLGLILFDRLQKPIVPTPDGVHFIEQAKIVIKEQQKLLQISKTKKGHVSGEFRLGIIPTVSTYILPQIVSRIAKAYPELHLFIEELKTESIIHGIKSDSLDGAILATPTHQQGFKEHALYYEPFYIYLSKNHFLLQKKTITADDIDPTQLWLLQDGNCFKDQVVNFCSLSEEKNAIFNNIHFQSGSLETLKYIVQKNNGYTLIPGMMLNFMSESEKKNSVRAFKYPLPTREISFIYRRDHWKLDIIDAIKKTIYEIIPEDMKIFNSKKHLRLEYC